MDSPRFSRNRQRCSPFGVWFANATTLYVSDESNGAIGKTVATFYAPAAAQTTAGLQKSIFNSGLGKWELAYTLTKGLHLGVPYIVPDYPTGLITELAAPDSPGRPRPQVFATSTES